MKKTTLKQRIIVSLLFLITCAGIYQYYVYKTDDKKDEKSDSGGSKKAEPLFEDTEKFTFKDGVNVLKQGDYLQFGVLTAINAAGSCILVKEMIPKLIAKTSSDYNVIFGKLLNVGVVGIALVLERYLAKTFFDVTNKDENVQLVTKVKQLFGYKTYSDIHAKKSETLSKTLKFVEKVAIVICVVVAIVYLGADGLDAVKNAFNDLKNKFSSMTSKVEQ